MLAAAVIATMVIGVGAIVGANAFRQPEPPLGETSGPASPAGPEVTEAPSPTPSVPESVPSLPIEPPLPSAAPSGGLTRTEAIEAARRGAPHAADYPEVIRADAGPFGTEAMGFTDLEYVERPADTRWVWVVMLCDGCGPLTGQMTIVILDYLDGRIYGVVNARG